MRSYARLGFLCGIIALLACNEDATGPRPVATGISIAAGAEQRGTVGLPLDTGLTVFVTDKFGDPVPGVLVRFSSLPGHGTLMPVAQTTGPGGHAASRWSLPTSAGNYVAFANAAGLDSLTFRATAAPAEPALITLVAGDSQAANTHSPVDSAIVVLVRDGYGNPVRGAAVTFAPGSGTVEPEVAQTDSVGLARTLWTLGDQTGTQAMVVRLDSLHTLRVQARVLRQSAYTGIRVAGYSFTGMWGGGAWDLARGVPRSEYNPGSPTPELACWQNALGATPLREYAGDSDPQDLGLGCPGVYDRY
jgi:hypothetical protein